MFWTEAQLERFVLPSTKPASPFGMLARSSRLLPGDGVQRKMGDLRRCNHLLDEIGHPHVRLRRRIRVIPEYVLRARAGEGRFTIVQGTVVGWVSP